MACCHNNCCSHVIEVGILRHSGLLSRVTAVGKAARHRVAIIDAASTFSVLMFYCFHPR